MRTYDRDVYAWATEQARLLRAGHFDLLDVEHIADEIEGVGKSEQRELANGLIALLAHLLQWTYLPARRSVAWRKTIAADRKEILYVLDESPSLAAKFQEPRWLEMIWARAIAQAVSETGLDGFPEECPWSIPEEVLNENWWPDLKCPIRTL